MSGGYRLDSDGDVEMSVPQPVYEFITAPKLKSWDQASLVTWTRERKRYVDKIAERCATTGENPERICASVKSCFDVDILAVIARYVLFKSVAEVNDIELVAEIENRCNHLKNAHVPDLDRLFRDRLKMNLRIDDCDARILHYFADFDRIIEDNGLTAQLGICPETDPFFKPRMKQRCKLLINSLQPEELRVEIQRMVKLEHREAATSCVKLYPLVLQRARLQHHYHYLRQEFGKSKDVKKQAPVVRAAAPASKPTAQGESKPRPEHFKHGAAAASKPQQRQPPRTGCWVCKGPHWLDDCSTASDAEKESARQKMTEMRSSRRQVKRWRLRGYAAGDGQSVRLNDLIDVPFCPDSGADANVVPRRVIDDLVELQSDVRLEPLAVPQEVEMYDGRVTVCTEEAHLDLRINTAAGPVNLYQVPCTVLDADTDEFLLGKITLRSLGIDMGRMIEQLAVAPNLDDSDDGLPPDSVFGIIDAGTHAERLRTIVTEAVSNGFPAEHADALGDLVSEFRDVFRSELETGEPARVEPLMVQLKADAVPYRCKARSYPPLQQQFLREYTKELEDRGLIRKNNLSQWASAVVPVKKPGTQGEFRMTVDYRRLNAMTVPIAGTASNLSVVTSSVRGSCGFASFDLHKGFWQMGLHADSQEMFSFMTPDAIYTPTRVPQGATDSALHFQNQMQFVFDPFLYNAVLICIDDVILFAKTVEEFLQALRKFFELLREFNLKLNIMKSKLFQLQAKWCGRLISGDGVAHDPERVDALRA
ncbi:hypothetical protein PR003_g30616, partial [Phytophthora rubi]